MYWSYFILLLSMLLLCVGFDDCWLGFMPLVSWKSLVGSRDDDWVDRMSHKWTVTLLVGASLFVTSGQWFGHPIQCWCPAEFKKWYRRYARNYCWVSNTYRLPMHDVIPQEEELRQKEELSYYHWVPIFLLTQALLFKLPYMLWHLVNPTCGINLSKLCKLIDDVQSDSMEDRRLAVQGITQYMHRWLLDRRNYHYTIVTKIKRILSHTLFFCFGQRFGVYLSGLYLFTKFLYLANCVIQFWLIGEFLQIDFLRYGPDNIQCMLGNCSAVQESPKFPRITLCDFKIRQMQNIQPFTVQCVLPINILNEKVFIILWVWILVVGSLTFFNLLSWSKYMLLRSSRQEYIKKYLNLGINGSKSEISLAKTFADKYLRHDGCFLMNIVQKNSSDVITKDIVLTLWENYSQPRLKEEEEEEIINDDMSAETVEVMS